MAACYPQNTTSNTTTAPQSFRTMAWRIPACMTRARCTTMDRSLTTDRLSMGSPTPGFHRMIGWISGTRRTTVHIKTAWSNTPDQTPPVWDTWDLRTVTNHLIYFLAVKCKLLQLIMGFSQDLKAPVTWWIPRSITITTTITLT
uniref:Uncharacterized protein n=1 Tax=Cacopsylla melanoneura TaxID=428564 RepID=A0A8D8VF71_9HEMI